jgi:hypothetical protein
MTVNNLLLGETDLGVAELGGREGGGGGVRRGKPG